MTLRTELYGLVVESELDLGGIAAPDGRAVDVRVHLAGRPAEAAAWPTRAVRPFYQSAHEVGESPALVADRPGDRGFTRLSYAEGIRFALNADATEVWSDWDPPLTVADAQSFLVGPILGLVLRRRGVLALHASGVVIDGRVWAFVGPGGAGKSTLAAAFAAEGFTVATEDVLALRPVGERWLAWPAYDHLRLWSDSPALRAGEGQRLPPLSPTWDKRVHALRPGQRSAEPLPMAGWFHLEPEPRALASTVVPLRGATALSTLVAHSYMNYLLDAPARERELSALGQAAAGLAAYRLVVGEGPAGLRETVRTVTSVARR